MPSEPALSFVLRPRGRAPFRAVALEDLTALVRIRRKLMAITREDLKKKRLQAMGVVGAQMDASAAMFDRVIAAGDKVAAARTAAETAQMAAIDAHVADLNEMADDMAEFTNGTPTTGGTSGAVSSTTAAVPAATIVRPLMHSAALATLNAAQPNPVSEAWAKSDAYVGTHPDGAAAKS